jgi:hypothetical protein
MFRAFFILSVIGCIEVFNTPDVGCIQKVKRRKIMSRTHYFILGLVLIITAACGDMEQATEGTDETGTAAEVAQTTVKETPPTPPQPKFATLSAGMVISVRLQDSLDSAVNQTGDTFRTLVDEDLLEGNSVVVPRGSLVEGKLTYVERSGRVKGRAAMSMQFVSIHVGGQTYPLQTEILSFEAEGTKKKDAAKVGVASGIGAAIGAIAGGGKGAAIGAAVGAGAGGATVAATRGEELKFNPEQTFQFTLNQDVQIRIR